MSTPYTYLSFEEDELLRPLAAQLFPPADSARDYLVRDALGALVISQATLDRTHAYQFIEFRDQRKLEAALTSYDAQLGKSRAIPKLEMKRSQVEDIKRFRRSIKEANKEADKEWDEPLVPKVGLLPPRLSDDFYLTRDAERAIEPKPWPAFESMVARLFSAPSSTSTALAELNSTLPQALPTTQDTIVSKYAMTQAQLDSIRQYRKSFTSVTSRPGLGAEQRDTRKREEVLAQGELLSKALKHERSRSSLVDPVSPDLNQLASSEEFELETLSRASPKLGHVIHPDRSPSSERDELDAMDTESSTSTASAKVNGDETRATSFPGTARCIDSTSPSTAGEPTRINMERVRPSAMNTKLATPEEMSPESCASFARAAPAEPSQTTSDRLGRAPVSGAENNLPIETIQRPSTEHPRAQEPRQSAQALSDNLTQNQAPATNAPNDVAEQISGLMGSRMFASRTGCETEDNGPGHLDSQDSASTSAQANVDLPPRTSLAPEREHVRSSNPLSTRPQSPTLASFSSLPPPYTLCRRAASFPPSRCPNELGGQLVIRNETDIERWTTDESGSVGIGMQMPGIRSAQRPIAPVDLEDRLDEERQVRGFEPSDARFMLSDVEEESETKTIGAVVPSDFDLTRPRWTSDVPKMASSHELAAFQPAAGLRAFPQLPISLQLSESLGRFMASRGRSSSYRLRENSSDENASQKAKSASEPRPAALAPSLPFPRPPFTGAESQASAPNSTLRVVVFDPVLEMRTLFCALLHERVELVHRPSRFQPSRFTIQDPHLITSGTSCALFLKLTDIIGNAVRDEPSDSATLTRQESIFSSLQRFSSRFDDVLVVFEQQQAQRDPYTPVVLEGLTRLSQALMSVSNDVGGQCHVVFSTSSQHSAALVRDFADFVKRKDETEARSGLSAWGERPWLLDDPHNDERSLLELSPLLNEMTASAIVSQVSLHLFARLSRDELESRFASLCGTERITNIFASLHPQGPLSSRSSPATLDQHLLPSQASISALGPPANLSPTPSRRLDLSDIFDVEKYEQDEVMSDHSSVWE
ncbi:hypothetical protein JCM3766R1_004901 [Sporobolomyces carnicolor]